MISTFRCIKDLQFPILNIRICNKEELGDEFHYLFNCTFFKDERIKFIPEYLYNVPNTISFSELMNSDDKYVLIGLSKYAKIVMSVFK
jgi:hypothetical protein